MEDDNLRLPPPISSIRCPFDPTPWMCKLLIPSATLEVKLLGMSLIVPGELYEIVLAKLSWYSGKEWGWVLGIHWLPNFISLMEICLAALAVTGDGKLIETLELRWRSVNAPSCDGIAECKTWVDLFSM